MKKINRTNRSQSLRILLSTRQICHKTVSTHDRLTDKEFRHKRDDVFCNFRNYPSTTLFAYSNDLSSDTVLQSWNFIFQFGSYSYWFGSVRFDIENINIQFDTNIANATSTIQNNLPDPNQGFQNSSVGSNVFDVIEKFFSNTQAPVCGSTIFILLKRYPNEADISRLVSLIRSHHSIVHVKASAAPSGGSQPKTMYSVSSKTNGMGLIENDDHFGNFFGWFSPSENPFPVYATTIQVSGSGTKTLPDFHPLISDGCSISITYQDHVPDDSLQNITLRWTNPGDSGNFLVNSSDISTYHIGGKYLGGSADFMGVNYKMALDYNYLGQDVQNLQIRIYSNFPLTNNWLPYSD
ncbi:hypothetical protein L5515_002490 [Caenorhabditis briggsae]|uniref:DUF7154 domain-containing protein n=1 Tax=Caenorhabditis briggsae TaxID=6238 RepID=A0AAE9E5K5_CAEBR|nr:hypothetical protein L5515_002490 [Caenorhabditis briggsae]